MFAKHEFVSLFHGKGWTKSWKLGSVGSLSGSGEFPGEDLLPYLFDSVGCESKPGLAYLEYASFNYASDRNRLNLTSFVKRLTSYRSLQFLNSCAKSRT